jgi:hypothetical protein
VHLLCRIILLKSWANCHLYIVISIMIMWKQSAPLLFLLLFCVAVLAATVRGIPGNPTDVELDTAQWRETGPLELSPERGRFALTYSLVEHQSFQFSLPLARFATPDVAYLNGGYVSLFPPGLSFLVIPGYLVGRALGAAQVGVFAVIALFALLNTFLLRAIALRLGLHEFAATVAALVFLFASPAFSYAVSFYQHHVSTFIILLSVYALMRWKTLWSVALVWFLWAAAVVIDSPNLFLMLPVALFALGRLIYVAWDARRVYMVVRPLGILTLAAASIPIAFFLWFNFESYGNPLQLAGTLRSVEAIDEAGNPAESQVTRLLDLENKKDAMRPKSALGFFTTRSLLYGFYIYSVSPDRGVLWYAPVVFLGIAGFTFMHRHVEFRNLMLLILGFNVLLYSMWGDPWGGWAFGSRYLIPSYAVLSLGLAFALHSWRSRNVFLVVFLALFSYSVWVNTLGALTTNANPPQVEVLGLEEISYQEEKYTFERNWGYLNTTGSKSLLWQALAHTYVDALFYHAFITSGIIILVSALLTALVWAHREEFVLDSASEQGDVMRFSWIANTLQYARSKLSIIL